MKNKIVLFVLIASTVATSIIAMDDYWKNKINTSKDKTPSTISSQKTEFDKNLKKIRKILITIACTKAK